MATVLKNRLLLAWLILSAITLGYLGMDRTVDENGTLRASSVVTITAIALALLKVRIIFQEFMEVRNAPPLLRRLTDLWVVLIGAILLGSYFVGLAVH